MSLPKEIWHEVGSYLPLSGVGQLNLTSNLDIKPNYNQCCQIFTMRDIAQIIWDTSCCYFNPLTTIHGQKVLTKNEKAFLSVDELTTFLIDTKYFFDLTLLNEVILGYLNKRTACHNQLSKNWIVSCWLSNMKHWLSLADQSSKLLTLGSLLDVLIPSATNRLFDIVTNQPDYGTGCYGPYLRSHFKISTWDLLKSYLLEHPEFIDLLISVITIEDIDLSDLMRRN